MIPKFRAWDKTKSEMHDVLVIDYLNEFIDLTYGNIEREFYEVELMQSTGLTDNNGTEIYEGDIVNVHEFTMGGSYDGAIELDTLYINAVITYNKLKENGLYEWCIKTKDFEFPINSLDGLHEESFDVVGNIYQNANLMEADSHESNR